MNFTREPILETIISAKEGYKLRLKSTKHGEAEENLVDAVEVVSFGTTFFYRSGEPGHTFFVPAQDFEIVQVRQARLVLKTPSEKAVKIAGGIEGGKKPAGEKVSDKKKKRGIKETRNSKAVEKKGSVDKAEDGTEIKKEQPSQKSEKKTVRGKTVRKTMDRKTSSREVKKNIPSKEGVQPSMFSHLLRPPEALISDTIGQYQSIIDNQREVKKEAMINITSSEVMEKVEAILKEPVPERLVAESLKSETPAPYEKLSEEVEEKPLTLKEKMKKVLSPSTKKPAKKADTE